MTPRARGRHGHVAVRAGGPEAEATIPTTSPPAPARAHAQNDRHPVRMTEHPQPPAPLADRFTALSGNLDQPLAAAASSGDEAAACGLDGDEVLTDRDPRSVVGEQPGRSTRRFPRRRGHRG